MQEKFNSLSENLKYFSRLSEQTVNILKNINNAIFTNAQVSTTKLTDSSGKEYSYTIPSFTYINNKLAEIDYNLKRIKNLGQRGNNQPLFSPENMTEPKIIEKVVKPIEFFSKPNLFFENLLNPLLFVKIDVSEYVSSQTRQVLSRRLLLNFTDSDLVEWFNNNLLKNDLQYDSVIKILKEKNIDYKIDDDIINMSPVFLDYSGDFKILAVNNFTDSLQEFAEYSYVKTVKLSTVYYTNNITNNSELLKKGNILIFPDDSTEYIVLKDADTVNNTCVIGLKSGFSLLQDKNGTFINFSIASQSVGKKYFEIPINYGEKQIIFLKAIDPYFHTTNSGFGFGFGFKSEDLNISVGETTMPFNDYYQQKTFDYGKQFQYLETINKIPASLTKTPNKPILTQASFSVKMINGQRFTNNIDLKIKQVLSDKVKLESQKTEYNKNIDRINTLLKNTNLTPTEANTLRSEQMGYISKLAAVIDQLETNTSEISNSFNYFNENIKPKYRVIGAFKIPEPVYHDTTGPQNIIKFGIRYRYLSSDNKPLTAERYEVEDQNGKIVSVTDDNWIYTESKVREKITIDGVINWSDKNDPINLINIPINSNESVEIQVQSISEGGFPENKFASDWSNPVIVTFPEDKFATDEYTLIYKSLLQEYFKNEYFKELTDLRKLVVTLSKSVESLDQQVLNMSIT